MSDWRKITSHQTNKLNHQIEILAKEEKSDQPQTWNIPPHVYRITGNPGSAMDIHFHVGSTVEGPNGLTNEALLAILIDRVESFQHTWARCEENAEILRNLKTALLWARERSRERESRGVEGKQEP